jgi:hypothetical protein
MRTAMKTSMIVENDAGNPAKYATTGFATAGIGVADVGSVSSIYRLNAPIFWSLSDKRFPR